MRVAWRFYDPVEDEEYFMPVNPNADSGSIGISKNITYSSSSLVWRGGIEPIYLNIVYENVDEPKQFSFSGMVYTAEDYMNLLYWSNKKNFIELTDDLDRTFEIYFSKFSIDRQKSRKFPWKHSYNIQSFVRNSS